MSVPSVCIKADSHIACRAHAVPMPFPCHAVPLRVYNVYFPFDLHSAAVSDSHLTMPCPCRAHAVLWPGRSSQGHGTARPSRDGLWATCPLSVSSGYHTEFHEGCYQKHTNFRCRWQVWNETKFVMNEENSASNTLQKRRSLKLLDLQFEYFRLPWVLSRRTRHYRNMAGARHGMCELTGRHGRGTAWARCVICESALTLL